MELEYRLRKIRLKGRPYILVIDPTNVCNLRCPLCPTGRLEAGRKGQLMSLETFQRAVDDLAPWAYKVNLFNWGESLLNPEIFDMIAYCRDKGLSTHLSSNLSLELSDEKIDRLLNSGLQFLCLSIDGASQDVYEKYRKKGDLELVLHNARRLVARRNELGMKRPLIEWQFIPMKHNEHEVETARFLAQEMGIDKFRCIPVGLPFGAPEQDKLRDEWFPIKVQSGQTEEGVEIASNDQATTSCSFLYRYWMVNPDAKVSPCCVVSGAKYDFGDIDKENFDAIWNNAKYRSARSQYVRNGNVEVPTVCDGCDLFEKRTNPPFAKSIAVERVE
ncbi:MAG: radical SAM protein [Pseudomonadales bacterium]|nr:radical SAM protein [Pseudomonadales bacterium]